MGNTQSARTTIRENLWKSANANPSAEGILALQSSALLLAGREGLTLAEQYENFVKLSGIIKILYPSGSTINELEAEAFMLVEQKIQELNPEPEVDVDQLEADFYQFLTDDNGEGN